MCFHCSNSRAKLSAEAAFPPLVWCRAARASRRARCGWAKPTPRGHPPSHRGPAWPVRHLVKLSLPTTGIAAPRRSLFGNQIAPPTVDFFIEFWQLLLGFASYCFFKQWAKCFIFCIDMGTLFSSCLLPYSLIIFTVVARCSRQCKWAPFYSNPLIRSSFRVFQLGEVMSETKRGRMTLFWDYFFFVNKTLQWKQGNVALERKTQERSGKSC